MSELITRVPEQHELRGTDFRRDTRAVESLPGSYLRGAEKLEEAERTASMLHDLGNELRFGDPEHGTHLVRAAYGVARNIGDMAIARMSSRAFSLLDDSRSFANAGSSFMDSGHVVGAQGAVTVRRDGSADYVLDSSIAMPNSESVQRLHDRLHEEGIRISETDASTLTLIHTAAHEAGHMIQRGVSKLVSGDYSATHDLLAKTVIEKLPEAGMTGNADTDESIHGERFAEGYGMMVLREAAAALGYDEATTDAIVRAIAIDTISESMHGHLAKVTNERSLKDVAEEMGEAINPGELGYTAPLTPEQIIADLETVARSDEPATMSLELAYTSEEQLPVNSEPTKQRGRLRRSLGGVGQKLTSLTRTRKKAA